MLSNKKISIRIQDLDNYDIISANFQEGKLIKRKKKHSTTTKTKNSQETGDLLSEATALIPDVLAALGEEEAQRQEDFVQVLRSIHAGTMSNSMGGLQKRGSGMKVISNVPVDG